MFQVIFILAVVLVVPAFFVFSWLMSRRHAKKKAQRGNSK
jgi:lipopolysaccharide biosynthesis regulator YciM